MKFKKAVKVNIIKHLNDESQGLVACELTDCKQKLWEFQGKPGMFLKEEINTNTELPCEGLLPCKIEAQRLDTKGKIVLLIDTARWKMGAKEAGGYFEVYDFQVVDW